jgi:hypothetical protein
MKSLLLPLALCALLGACAAPAPVAPAYYVTTPVPVDPLAVPQPAYPPVVAYPYAYPYPYPYAPYWVDPFFISGTFFCCSFRHHHVHHVHRVHGMNRWHGGQPAGARMALGARGGRADRR